MSQTLPIVLVASLLAGGAGAVATTMLTAAPVTTTEAGTDTGSDTLLAELHALTKTNQELSDRLDALESGSGLAPVAGQSRSAARAPEMNLEDAVRDVLASMTPEDAPAATPQLAAAVESVLDMREERERLEREQARAEVQAKRLEDRLAKMQTDLGLDQGQMNSMREIYQTSDVKRDEMRTEMRTMRENGGSWEDMRGMMVAAREETKTSIQGVLNPTQFEQYEESYQDDRGGRGGRGGGGDDAGGGGGGGRRGR